MIADDAAANVDALDAMRSVQLPAFLTGDRKAWSAKIASFDGFVFVTPEYNHATSAALKNAIDYLYAEWNHKAAGFVGYGGAGGARAVENLRLVMGELLVADVRAAVALSVHTDWTHYTTFNPAPQQAKTLDTMLDQVVAWSRALAPLRSPAAHG